jgi:hypothetical protein
LILPSWAAKDLKKGQPQDAALFIDRYVECNHWGGEEPYDAERKKEIRKRQFLPLLSVKARQPDNFRNLFSGDSYGGKPTTSGAGSFSIAACTGLA